MTKKQQTAFKKTLKDSKDFLEAAEILDEAFFEREHSHAAMSRRVLHYWTKAIKCLRDVVKAEEIDKKTGKEYFEAKKPVTPETKVKINAVPEQEDGIEKPKM